MTEEKNASDDNDNNDLMVAAEYLREASHILVVAGAGMSAYERNGACEGNVYVDPKHFKKHYPDMVERGYTTSYDAMAFFDDTRFDIKEKWGYQARHMRNMGYAFPPCGAYGALKSICDTKDSTFVLTSNVDGCFRRAGFDAKYIYTPQGEWSFYQCMKKCSDASVWPSVPMLAKTLPRISLQTGALEDLTHVPRCKRCGSHTFGNVRGGKWFSHAPYADSQRRLIRWIETRAADEASPPLAVLEIGCGFNTPIVTRFPAVSIASDLGARARFIRINPSDADVPRHLIDAIGIRRGWGVLRDLGALVRTKDAATRRAMRDAAEARRTLRILAEKGGGTKAGAWRGILKRLSAA